MLTRTRMLLFALVTGFILAGCQSLSSMPRSPGSHVVCRTSTCDVRVSVRDRMVTVDVDVLEVAAGNRNVDIFWHLPPGYSFIMPTGDGVFFYDDDKGQFEAGYATDEESGKPSANRRTGQRYHWHDLNTVPGQHAYRILFHDRAGNFYSLDPMIMNGR